MLVITVRQTKSFVRSVADQYTLGQQEFVWLNRCGTCFVVRFSWQRPNGTRNTACPELVEGQHEFGENHMKSERA